MPPVTLRISEAASLAMHAMVLLAARPGERLSTARMAEVLGASEAHLAKVMQQLGRARLVRSARGRGGGFVLARGPESISLLEVYRAVEGPLPAGGCLLARRICSGRRCILGGLVGRVNRQVGEYLARTRLSDLVDVFGRRRRAT